MSQRVPSCDVDDNNNYIPTPTKFPLLPNSNFITHEVPMLNYKVGELACKKGEPTIEEGTIGNLTTTWDKPRTNDDTLESIVNQHVIVNNNKWHKLVTMDALVPCCSKQGTQKVGVVDQLGRVGACMSGCSARVAYSSEGEARVPVTRELSGSETYPKELSLAFNSASMGSPENTTSSAKHCTGTTTNDDRDSFSHRRSWSEARNEDYKTTRVDKSCEESNKRIKASAIHNQSERRRRDKINQRMKELQKLVPNSSKNDKASMLDEVIQYMRQLQAQVQMMNWMKMYSSMMLPITMQQQQLKMSMMMAQMCMGMGMNKDMVMNMNMNGINIPGIPPLLHPNPFMPMASFDQLQGAPEKPVTMDAYSRMAALYHQLYNPPVSSSKS